MGDTAIYFAREGAAKIHAYEPVPEAYDMLIKNLELNKLETVIVPHNSAVSDDKGVRLQVDKATFEGSTSFVGKIPNSQDPLIQPKHVTLKQMLAECSPETKKILKMNCEGGEFLIVTRENLDDLKFFDRIICYCHSYLSDAPEEQLVKIMQDAGFHIRQHEASLIVAERIPKAV